MLNIHTSRSYTSNAFLINDLPLFQVTVHYLSLFLKFALTLIDSGNFHLYLMRCRMSVH